MAIKNQHKRRGHLFFGSGKTRFAIQKRRPTTEISISAFIISTARSISIPRAISSGAMNSEYPRGCDTSAGSFPEPTMVCAALRYPTPSPTTSVGLRRRNPSLPKSRNAMIAKSVTLALLLINENSPRCRTKLRCHGCKPHIFGRRFSSAIFTEQQGKSPPQKCRRAGWRGPWQQR